MSIISAIFGPQFLVQRIPQFALIIGAVILVIFSDIINKNFIFPIADWVKKFIQSRSKKHKLIGKYISEGLATIIFVIYCYLGAVLLAEHLLAPIMQRARDILLIILLIVFALISYAINQERERFLKF